MDNGGTITVTGTAPAGKPVYIEVWAEKKVRASRFDADVDKETGKRPYVLYMMYEMPAHYKIYIPKDKKEDLEKIKKEGKKWAYSKALKDLGADIAYSVPAKAKIDRYQATLMGSIIGSRGDMLAAMDEKENKKRSMQLVKARFRRPRARCLRLRWKLLRTEHIRLRYRSPKALPLENIRSWQWRTRMQRASLQPSKIMSTS